MFETIRVKSTASSSSEIVRYYENQSLNLDRNYKLNQFFRRFISSKLNLLIQAGLNRRNLLGKKQAEKKK